VGGESAIIKLSAAALARLLVMIFPLFLALYIVSNDGTWMGKTEYGYVVVLGLMMILRLGCSMTELSSLSKLFESLVPYLVSLMHIVEEIWVISMEHHLPCC
jgi:hypothetical protein